MNAPNENAFKQFTTQRKRDLQRIARATRGEHQLSDVIAEVRENDYVHEQYPPAARWFSRPTQLQLSLGKLNRFLQN